MPTRLLYLLYLLYLRLVTSGLATSSYPNHNPNLNPSPNPNPKPNPNANANPSPNPHIRTGDVFEHAVVKNAAPFGLFLDVGVGARLSRKPARYGGPARPTRLIGRDGPDRPRRADTLWAA